MISIIVPVYRAEQYIEQTIETVVRQTYRDWELLLVDDCSPDHSAAVIEAAIARYEAQKREQAQQKSGGSGNTVSASLAYGASGQIRLIRKQVNEGAARARNTGLEQARGRYIAFLDADDLWDPEKLEKEMRFMRENDAGFVYTSYQFGDENGVPTGKVARARRVLSYREALAQTIIFTSTVLIDTEKIGRELIRMPEIASEDTATWWRILQSGVCACGLDEPLAIYRRPPRSLSSNKGKAVRRIWGLYRQIAGLGRAASLFYLVQWAWHATMRRVVSDSLRKIFYSLSEYFSSQYLQR
ncbi:MAG: glycosyltransferase family 2 protein [Eubacteriales bacterium]|nr:glycosyltransferase family 2 protein [Eubacteriales bacterium]